MTVQIPVYNAPVEIAKAHDVRRLRACHYCGGLGRDDCMVERNDALYHGRCFINRFGLEAFLALPTEQTHRVTLDDIGVDAMRALLDRGEK